MVSAALRRIPAPPAIKPDVPVLVPVAPEPPAAIRESDELRLDELDEVVGGLERPYFHNLAPSAGW